MTPYYEQDGIVIYHGDCRDVLPELSADVLITDPPYGVGFSGKVTKHTDHSGGASYLDTEDHFRETVLPAVRLALSKTVRGGHLYRRASAT